MRLLLDTHVLLWAVGRTARLSARASDAIKNSQQVIVSVASVWEVEIKRALGKLEAPEDLPYAMAVSGFDELPILLSHAVLAGRLPRHHDDPFDRMLVAQAVVEDLVLVTADPAMSQYDVRLLKAA